MELYIDSGDVTQIKAAVASGLVSGVTTNPTLISKSFAGTSTSFEQGLRQIIAILNKEVSHFTVSAEVTAPDAKTMIVQGIKLAKLDPHIVVKIPMTEQGLVAVQALTRKKVRTNVTLVFSANQALLAAKAGAFMVSPFIGRLDDVGQDGMVLINQIRTIFDNYDFRTKILAASIRSPRQVTEAALSGADICTVPYGVFEKLFKHPLTDQGLEQFDKDWAAFTRQ